MSAHRFFFTPPRRRGWGGGEAELGSGALGGEGLPAGFFASSPLPSSISIGRL